MSILSFIDQLKSSLRMSIDQHRDALSQMTHVIDLNSRFSFIQALEGVVKLVENMENNPQFKQDAISNIEDAAEQVITQAINDDGHSA